METMTKKEKNNLASVRKLSEGEERLLRELDAVRAERNKTVGTLLEACKEVLHGLQLESESNDGVEIRNRRRIKIAKQAIANAEK